MAVKHVFRLSCIIWLISLCYSSSGQNMKKNSFKVNYLSSSFTTLSCFYERSISKNLSVQLGIFYTPYTYNVPYGVFANGFGVTPELRVYLNKKGKGFFLAPYLRYMQLKIDDGFVESITMDKYIYGGGFVCGKKWIVYDWLVLECFGGPQFLFDTQGNDNYQTISIPTISLRAGATIGITF